jgi:hypothetical protein
MACARACLAALLEIGSMCGSITAASPDPKLTLRVYNLAHVEPHALRGARQVTAQILERAGIRSVWTAGDVNAGESHLVDARTTADRACDDALRSSELRIRLVPAAPPGLPPMELAFALPCARYGVQVTVFIDRIEQVAARISPCYATVLGHAIAHEVGHVLLRSEQHASTGLMRAVWDRKDWDRVATAGLWFTVDEAAFIRRELLRVPSPAPTPSPPAFCSRAK